MRATTARKQPHTHAMIRDEVARYLSELPGSTNSERDTQAVLDRLDLESFEIKQLVAENVRKEIAEQTKAKPLPRSDDLFNEAVLAAWIPAADGGRIKFVNARFPDLTIHREQQIRSMRSDALAFDASERRREHLSEIGMASNPEMTVAQALKQH